MRCCLRHTGRVAQNLSVSDFTLAPGFTSPDLDLVEGSPDDLVVREWVDEGLIEILPPTSAGKVETVSRVGGRSKVNAMTAEEVREYMSPASKKKRRRSTVLTRAERNMATHKPPIGMPFGPKKGTRIFTQEDLAKGKPEAAPHIPPPEGNKLEDKSKKGKIYTDKVPPTGLAIRPDEAEGKEFTPDDLKKMNKANPTEEVVVDETTKEAAEKIDAENTALDEKEMGDQPVDNVILDIFVDQLDEMTKKEITAIAEKAGIDLPNQINKAPLVATVAEKLVKMGYTELPS